MAVRKNKGMLDRRTKTDLDHNFKDRVFDEGAEITDEGGSVEGGSIESESGLVLVNDDSIIPSEANPDNEDG